jgi:histidyl-tRNA synthetase
MPKDKPAKARRPRAETPKGFRDYFGAEVLARQAMLARITEVYRLHGFDPLETSAVETVEALGKYLPDVDRPNEGVFAWTDDDETWLALRYDLTAPLARSTPSTASACPRPTAATRWARSGATRSRGRGAFASSTSATPTRSGRRVPPPTPRWPR